LSDTIDLGLGVLDHQLLDKDGRRCGKVDDLAIEGGAGEEPRVVAILSGPGVWRERAGWLGRLAALVGGGRRVRIPWEEVAKVGAHVELKRAAAELGLGRGDDKVRPFVDRIPGADR
jgi:sporulation protein YlmC with PRC-barrel domain